MKKIFLTISTLLCVLLMTLLSACNLFAKDLPTPSLSQYELSDQVVRIHIRANSNSRVDQDVKLLVRDKITEHLSTVLSKCQDKKDALCAIKNQRDKLQQIADCTLKASGFDYKSAVLVKTEHFPSRTYGNLVFPSGNYDALIIELGSGRGDNWWCVAFPPLCFVPDGEGEKVVYKSWVKELIDKIFG